MKKIKAIWITAIAVFAYAGSLAAHHSLGQFETTTPIWVKGTVIVFKRVNPHSVIFLDQKQEDGKVQRWAVDGPGPSQLERLGVSKDLLKAGDIIEVCGFTTKEGVPSQRDLKSSAPNMSGRILNGHVVVTADGKKRFWSDYGLLGKCLSQGETRESLIH